MFTPKLFCLKDDALRKRVPSGILYICYLTHTTTYIRVLTYAYFYAHACTHTHTRTHTHTHTHTHTRTHTNVSLHGTSAKLYSSPLHLSTSNFPTIDPPLRLYNFPENRCQASITQADVFNKNVMRKKCGRRRRRRGGGGGGGRKDTLLIEEKPEGRCVSACVCLCLTWQPFSQVSHLLMWLARNFF